MNARLLSLNVKINGKLIPLKLGLNPQAPVQVALKAEIQRLYRPGNIDLYLQLRNNLKETKQLSTELKRYRISTFL